MASATLKSRILRTLEARKLILGSAIEVGVVYRQAGNESYLVCGHYVMHYRTIAGEIGSIFADNWIYVFSINVFQCHSLALYCEKWLNPYVYIIVMLLHISLMLCT